MLEFILLIAKGGYRVPTRGFALTSTVPLSGGSQFLSEQTPESTATNSSQPCLPPNADCSKDKKLCLLNICLNVELKHLNYKYN